MPAVTRIGDADVTHCSGMTRAAGSSNVFVNGIAVSRQGDIILLIFFRLIDHLAQHTQLVLASGSSTVKVNGKGCGRVGDGIAGCTSVAAGSSNVFAGG